MNNDLKTIKEIPILEIAKRYGIKMNKNSKALCPFHEDTNPSLSFDIKKNRFKCFGCNAGSSVIDFVMRMENIDFQNAIERLKAMFPHLEEKTEQMKCGKATIAHYQDDNTQKQNQPTEKSLEIYAFFYNQLVLEPPGRGYLKQRNISEKTCNKFHIKSISKPLRMRDRLKKDFKMEDLIDSGLFIDKVKFIFGLPSIIFPYFRKGKPVYFSSRTYKIGVNNRHMKQTGEGEERYFFGQISKEMVCFESVFDALSYYELTGKMNFISFNGKIAAKIDRWRDEFHKIMICFDNDSPGENDFVNLKERMKFWKPEQEENTQVFLWKEFLSHFAIDERTKDMNEFLVAFRKKFPDRKQFIDFKPFFQPLINMESSRADLFTEIEEK